MKRKAIKSVIHNSLFSLISRNTDYDGYWIWGYFVEPDTLREFSLSKEKATTTEEQFFLERIDTVLNDQCSKAKVVADSMEWNLILGIGREKRITYVNGFLTFGYVCNVRLEVLVNGDTSYGTETAILVAKHNPSQEYRSGRSKDVTTK